VRLGVGGGHRADVPTLHVRYGRQAEVTRGPDQVGIDSHSYGTETLEEGCLKLDGGDVRLNRLEYIQAELQGRFGVGQVTQFLGEA
jgi:hypothetical protein